MNSKYNEITPFRGENDKYHFIYRTHNLITGKEYTGKHSSKTLWDGYYGSNSELSIDRQTYGDINFAREFLSFHLTELEAYNEEQFIVDWEYVNQTDTYNKIPGGIGYEINYATYKDSDGKIIRTKNSDSKVLSGELVGIQHNKVTVKDQEGKTQCVAKDDPKYICGDLVHNLKNTVLINNGTKNVRISTSEFDPVKHKSIHKNMVNVVDDCGNTFKVSKDDPRYISGELKFHLIGKKWKNKMKTRICPHCGKVGKGGRMTVHHFDNCKLKP